MMYVVVVLSLMVVAAAGEQYTTKYDGVDLPKILNNDRLLNNYFACVMGDGKCTADGQELKDNIPDALESECAKCSEKQKQGSEEVLKFLFEKKQDMFKKLEEKYDPQGKYRIKYKKRIEAAGLKA